MECLARPVRVRAASGPNPTDGAPEHGGVHPRPRAPVTAQPGETVELCLVSVAEDASMIGASPKLGDHRRTAIRHLVHHRIPDMKTRHVLTRIAACVIAATAIGMIVATPIGIVAIEDRTLTMPNRDVDIGTHWQE